jgi:glycosyl transferase family 25
MSADSFWSQIDKIFYINLDSRQDRNQHVLNQLDMIGAPQEKIERFSAIKHERGYIGCTLSHIECMKLAIQRNYKNIMVIEDDIHFTDNVFFKNNCNKIFAQNFDAFMIGVHIINYEIINDDFIKVIRGLTTTGYIIRNHYFQKLLENYDFGVKNLILAKNNHQYSIDVHNSCLQKQDNWISFRNLTVSQIKSFSDIENQIVDYDHCMLKKI